MLSFCHYDVKYASSIVVIAKQCAAALHVAGKSLTPLVTSGIFSAALRMVGGRCSKFLD